jgi:DNA-binding NarL/FixJ family response regulator
MGSKLCGDQETYPGKVIILSMHNDHSMISKLMEIGANSYLTKNSDSKPFTRPLRPATTNSF